MAKKNPIDNLTTLFSHTKTCLKLIERSNITYCTPCGACNKVTNILELLEKRKKSSVKKMLRTRKHQNLMKKKKDINNLSNIYAYLLQLDKHYFELNFLKG